MKISEFYTIFSDEQSCINDLIARRNHEGIQCKKCECKSHYWLKSKQQWQCKRCAYRTTIRSGTLFESSNLPLLTWYQAIYLIANTKKGVSACELQRLLGLKRYEPAWYMQQKIRKMMARINESDQNTGDINLDNSFFTTIDNQGEKPDSERIRYNYKTKLQKALIMVESEIPKKKSYKGKCGRIRILATNAIEQNTVWTLEDNKKIVNKQTEYLSLRNSKILKPHENHFNIIESSRTFYIYPWVRTAIGNIKRLIRGIYHHISDKFAQLYFDEFVFKFNYRNENNRWNTVLSNSLNIRW